MKCGTLNTIHGTSFENELDKMINSENVFLKGVAYRYKGLLQRQQNLPHEKIIDSFILSLKFLEESGHQLELAKSHIELSKQYLLVGDENRAKESSMLVSKILSLYGESLIPEDLKCFNEDIKSKKNYLQEILKLSQEVVTIRDDKDRVQHIISSANRITGAERGAIFLLDGTQNPFNLQLRASKNLSVEEITDLSFEPIMKMIEEVAQTGKGRILGIASTSIPGFHSSKIIRSSICVPMVFKDSVVGVMYHDNRLLSSAFRETDLELLTYFAALAAFSMENSKAYEEVRRLNQKLMEEKRYYEEQHLQSLYLDDIVGESPAIMRVLAQANQVAKTDTTVLILGDTGVGKELVARAIHSHSDRKDKPFIKVTCNTMPESLICTELFGHEKGAFTGAISKQIGRFELADGGTLFLDEVGDLPLEVQARLLQALESKEFERVGGSKTIRSDFRLLAATNRDLQQEVKAQKFRSDLYYRLNVFRIQVPPLRERKEDIPLLAQHFLVMYSNRMGKTFRGILKADMEKLIQYSWPGNVRELKNIIERGCILSSGPHFRLPELEIDHVVQEQAMGFESLNENERRHIVEALQKTGWKIRGPGGAAELLAIHPSTLAFRMKKLGIKRPREVPRKRACLLSSY
jgi:transcriptional regulator with GAF, ATPase, and Fis domain